MPHRKDKHSAVMQVQRRCEDAETGGSFRPGERSTGRPVAGEEVRKRASGETGSPLKTLIRWLVGPRRRDHNSDVRHDR